MSEMISFRFIIDKEACFAYWLQQMLDLRWDRPGKKDAEHAHWKGILEQVGEEGGDVLNQLKFILEKPESGYFWLWGRYVNNAIGDESERVVWERVRRGFRNAFEKIWEDELPRLEVWQKRLSGHDMVSVQGVLEKTQRFWGVPGDFRITVQLHINIQTNGTSAHAKREFPDIILLGCSHLEEQFVEKALNAIAHETAHSIDYRSNKKQLLDAVFREVTQGAMPDSPLLGRGGDWWRALVESIVFSVAGRNFSYLIRRAYSGMYMNMSDREKLEAFQYAGYEHDAPHQITSVAYRLRDLTAQYLDGEREMDHSYVEEVVRAWMRLYGIHETA